MRSFACILAAITAIPSAAAAVLAIKNVVVIDVAGGPARERISILVSEGKIAAIGSGVRIPRGAKTVDGAGKFVIPGLWDMHVRLAESDTPLEAYLANGVLRVRDMGGNLEKTLAWAREIEAGKRVGPKIYTSGPMTADVGPEEARRSVDAADEGGADFINVLPTLSEDAYTALAQRARVRRIPFAGDVPESVSVLDAITARQKSIDHLFGVALACSPQESRLRRWCAESAASKDYAWLRRVREMTQESFDADHAEKLFKRMAMYGVWQIPSLSRNSYTHPYLDGATAEEIEANRKFHRKLTEMMQRAGVGLLAGSGAEDPSGLHDELELLVGAGLTPIEALAAATINSARYFNSEATSGTVDRGKQADFIVLDADPRIDIRNTRRVSAVVIKGKMLDRKQIDTILGGSHGKRRLEHSAGSAREARDRARE